MIIVKLMGGLGNQLFQYALGRNLAEIHQTKLKLDISMYTDLSQQEGHSALRNYELKHFNIVQNFASAIEIKSYTEISKNIFTYFKQKFIPHYSLAENGYAFDSNILKAHNNTYLYGYWQTEKYFKSIEHMIRKEIQLIHGLDSANEIIRQEILQHPNSISLHIRRSDYVTDMSTSERIGALHLGYYEKAIAYYAEKLGKELYFYIFSDDLDWAKANLKIKYNHHFMDGNDAENAYKDLILISNCQHHIIANSTFSWWGAWLGKHPNKIVVAPKNWFKENAKWINGEVADTKDVIPDNWIKL